MDDSHTPMTMLESAALWHVRLREDDASVEEFESWLAEDPAHRLAYAEVCLTDFALAQSDVADGVRKTPSVRSVPGRRRMPRRHGAWAVAASLVILLGGTALAWLQPARWQQWASDAASAAGQVRELRLEDGSRLWLAPDSAVDIRIDPSMRRIELRRGEVFASVVPDVVRPFDIVADDVVARAVGTRYAVARMPTGVEVAVEEGRVAVRSAADGYTIELDAGHALRLRRDAAPSPPNPIDDARFAWRRGLLVLENATIDEAVARLDAYLPQRIVWLPREAGDSRRITAAIPAGDAAAALDAIVREHGLIKHDLAGVVTVIR